MTNLLPPHAKKHITTEYWIRMMSAWAMLWSVGFVIGIIVLLPTYVLIHGHIQALSLASIEASEKTAEFSSIRESLSKSTRQANAVQGLGAQQPLSTIVTDVTTAGMNIPVTVERISVMSDESVTLQPIRVSGNAVDRQALADYRTQLLELPYADEIELPIQSLAANEDVTFNLLITIDETYE